MPGEKWRIEIDRHRGYAPRYYENSYPVYGNKFHAAEMKDIDILDPNTMKPGPYITDLTAGNESGAVDESIKSILKTAVTSGVSYAIGGALLHKISNTAVTNAGIWPKTIAGTGAITGEDVIHYKGKLLYTFNDAGAAGEMGTYDLSSTFDDTYWSSTLSGTALLNAPHQMINGGDDIVYIANGRYIALLDGTTENDKGLDFWEDSEVATLTWNYNRVLAGVNRPNITGANINQSAIYRWNGYDGQWEGDPVEVNGEIGALLTKNGITYVWYKGYLNGSLRLVFGMMVGGEIVPIRTFSGSLPAYYQVFDMGNYIGWLSGDDLLMWGPVDSEVKTDLFYYTTAKYSTTVGGVAAPFGSVLIGSDNGTNYSLGKAGGYSISAAYKTLTFPTAGSSLKSKIDKIVIETNTLATGAKVNLTLRDSLGTALWTDEMSYTTDGAVNKKTFRPKVTGNDFRLEFSHTNGSTSNPVNIRKTIIEGINIPAK